MIDRIAGLVNADARLVHRGRFVHTSFMIAIDDACALLRVQEGRITQVTPGPFITPDYSFCLRAPREVWDKFWQPLPPLGYSDIFALVNKSSCRSKATCIHSWPTCFISRTSSPPRDGRQSDESAI